MAADDVHALEWDANAEHLARHGIRDFEVDQMLSNRHLLAPNRRNAPRRFLLGTSNSGRALVVVIEPTNDPGTWRPITAWDADEDEKRRLRERA
jgi:uncharacterized DUF497 family protein